MSYHQEIVRQLRTLDGWNVALEAADLIESLTKGIQAKQAQIDWLMLEYCPEDMTPEQMAEFARHQRAVTDEEAAAIDEARKA